MTPGQSPDPASEGPVPVSARTATVEITWLGHAGFRLAAPGVVVLVDPWLADHRLRTGPPPALADLGNRVDWVLATHEHDDHLDLQTMPKLVARFPGARLITPAPIEPQVRSRCPSLPVVGVQPGDHLRYPGLTIDVVSARHAVSMAEGYSDACDAPPGQARFVGFVLHIGGLRVYHGGDTLVSDATNEKLRRLGVDVALLPVNGRDHFREATGIVGNMNAAEAVMTAAAIGATTLVPMHHDAVRGNTERAGAASDAARDLRLPVHVLNLTPLIPAVLTGAIGRERGNGPQGRHDQPGLAPA